MLFSRIKTKRIYVVNFNPVYKPEFDSEHLALVLKKNNDKKTCIVMPLTSESNGVGANKINIGKINTLPTNLKETDTYAVYDQVRTVNVSRFKPLKEGQDFVDAIIDDTLFFKLLDLCTSELLYTLTLDERINFHKKQYEKSYITKMISLSYDVLKIEKKIKILKSDTFNDNTILIDQLNSQLESIKTEIMSILQKDIEYTLTKEQVEHGIKKVLDSLVNYL